MVSDFAFFSLVFEVVGALDGAVAVFAFFSANLFAFSAFLRSFSTKESQNDNLSALLLVRQ